MTEKTFLHLIPLLLAALQWVGCEATGRDANPEERAAGTGADRTFVSATLPPLT